MVDTLPPLVTSTNKTEAIQAFRARAVREGFSDESLLGELLRARRFEEAETIVGEPGQATVGAFEAALGALKEAAHAERALRILCSIVDQRPAIEKLSPLRFLSGEPEARPVHERALQKLGQVYGPALTFSDWDGSARSTLLHVCEGWMAQTIRELVDAGADPVALDAYGRTPLQGMTALGELSPETLRVLAPAGLAASTLEAYLDESTGRPLAERIAVIGAAAERGVSAGGEPITSLARTVLARDEREALLSALEVHGVTGGTRTDALVTAAHSGTSEALAHWLELAEPKVGETFNYKGKGQTLLHIRLLSARPGRDEGATVADLVRSVETLLARGESTSAKNQRKETPIDLWHKQQGQFSPAGRRKVEAVLGIAREVGATLADRFEDPAFAYAVASALLRGKQLREAALTKLAKTARKGVDASDREALERVILGAVHELPLAELDLGSVSRLSWSWDEPFFRWLAKTLGDDEGGESDVLALTSLAGIAALIRLESLELTPDSYAGGIRDLGPLSAHPTLRYVELPNTIASAAPLLSMPKLRTVKDACGALSEEARASLVARGVEIVR